MAKTVTSKRAQAALDAVREQFKSYIGEDEGPKLVKGYESCYGSKAPYAIVWEDYAPYDWAIRAGENGGLDEEMSSLMGERVETAPAKKWPATVWSEPVNGYVLALYPLD